MTTQEKREQRLTLLEDHIGRSLAESEKTGELRHAPSFGRPMNHGDGYEETPEELRLAYKMLKDSGYLPPEVELMREIEALRSSLATLPPEAVVPAQQQLTEMRQRLALRLEKLRGSRAL